MEPYFSANYVAIFWDEESQSVVARWQGFAFSHEFRTGMDKLIELLSLKGASQILADSAQQEVIAVGDQNWSNKDWYPRAVQAGCRRIALVNPQNSLGQMSVDRIVKSMAHPEIEQGFFATQEEARQWLISKANNP